MTKKIKIMDCFDDLSYAKAIMRKSIRLLIAFLLLPVVFSLAEEQGKKPPEVKRLVVSLGGNTIDFHPHRTYSSLEAQLFTALYEGLVSYNPFSLEPVPAVARYWDVLEGGTLYRFHLRDSARYWNGDPVRASDFRNAWIALLDPALSAPYSSLLDIVKGAYEYRTGKTNDPDTVGIRVNSEDVLEVELTHPAEHFLKILCHHSFVPIHPSALPKSDWSGDPSILGNGPFYITGGTKESLILSRNNLYWDRKNVSLPGIELLFSDDEDSIAAGFNEGTIHWAASAFNLNSLKNFDYLMVNPMFSTYYFFFSCKLEPFSDPDVRKALALLIPWNEVRSKDYMRLPTDVLVPALPNYPRLQGIVESDAAKALEILAAKGFKKGEPALNAVKPVIKIPAGEETLRVANLIKKGWEEALGIEVTVKQYDYREYYSELKKEDYTIGTLTWIGDFADPLTFLQMWTRESNLNDAGFFDEEFDEIIERSMSLKGKARYEALGEAEKILIGGGTVLPLSHSPAFNIVNTDEIEGWFPNPLDIHPFKYIEFIEAKVPKGVAMGSIPRF
jgi:oligopeptide transport system substrate-binding protein